MKVYGVKKTDMSFIVEQETAKIDENGNFEFVCKFTKQLRKSKINNEELYKTVYFLTYQEARDYRFKKIKEKIMEHTAQTIKYSEMLTKEL